MTYGPTEQGLARLRRGDPAGALASFREAIDGEPNDLAAWRGIVRASVELRIWSEVARALERVIALSSDRKELVPAHLARGFVLDRELGDPAGARAHYEKALLVHPDQVWPYLALAEIDLRTRRWSRAIAHADHGLEFCAQDAPERPALLLVKAIAMQRVSVSMGPQSSFFRALRGDATPGPEPGERAFRQAQQRLPELAGLSYRGWLEDTEAALRFVRDQVPRPSLAI